MENKTRWIVIGSVVTAAVLTGGGFALAGAADDDEQLTGTSLERATDAALAHTGGGTVIETEVGDDGAAYGVEVRTTDGSVVEVNLDEQFQVIGQAPDDDSAEE